MLRCPIISVLGHVDSGKTSILDAIRETKVGQREAGGITQQIGASEIPLDVIKERCGDYLNKMKVNFTIPGILVIDTPGHEVFTNLRKRGGSIADIAILVVDVNKGIEPQTIEAMGILKEFKTPYVIALNKIDAISGWRPSGSSVSNSLTMQRQDVLADLDTKIYQIIGKLYEFGINAERFDRVADFTKQVLIIPVSARSKEGLPELLTYVTGLAQKFLEKQLETKSGAGKGNILEVSEERGLGKTLDVILYDGELKEGDEIAFASVDGVVFSRIKALLKPKPLDEMRDPREKFTSVERVVAAAGVKIACEGADRAVAGSTLMAVEEGKEDAIREEISKELKEIIIENETAGIILKADSLGSLEAITRLFGEEKIAIKRTAIGRVSKADVNEAAAIAQNDKFLGVIVAFNQSLEPEIALEAEKNNVKVFDEKIIYNLVEGYKRWRDEEKAKEKKEAFLNLTLPAKIVLLQRSCFRMSNPCIFGIEILAGRIRKDYTMMDETGKTLGTIGAIHHNKESLAEAKKGQQVAISMTEPTYGRQVCEKQVLYSCMTRDDVKQIEDKYLQALDADERETLKEIKKIKGLVTTFFK